METTRIRKLLRSEYGELTRESILVESPFAETTRDGRGLREVALGLTRTRLIVAADVFRNSCCQHFWCPPGVDPSIESLELVSIYPLEFITLSVFRRRHRKALKARLIDGRVKYYELGGMKRRSTLWTLWCKQVRRILESRCLGSSLSETTVATSSTGPSTSYYPTSGFEYDSTSGRCRKRKRNAGWVRCAGDGNDAYVQPIWTHKDLYLGPAYEELRDASYAPMPHTLADASVGEIKSELKDHSPNKARSQDTEGWSSDSNVCHRKSCKQQSGDVSDAFLTRRNDRRSVDQRLVASAIKENTEHQKIFHELLDFQPEESRSSGGYCPSVILDIEDPESESFTCDCHQVSKTPISKNQYEKLSKKIGTAGKIVRKLSRFGFGVEEKCSSSLCLGQYKNGSSSYSIVDPHKLIESGVSVWESARKYQNQSSKRHIRRYGISTATYFLHALGPWSVQPGDRESVQSRRSHSCVTIRRQPANPELRLPVSRRQLAASISLTDLNNVTTASTRRRVVLFWTPDYWYRPRAATDAYREIRKHLGQLRKFRAEKEKRQTRCRMFGRRNRFHTRNWKSCDTRSQSTESNSCCMLNRVCAAKTCDSTKSTKHQQGDRPSGTTTAHLRRLLKLDFRVTLWDLDSTTLARQLTLVDRELFLRVPRHELEVVARQRTSRDAPNLGAWIAFAHRVSCLTASEVLAARKLDMRARLVARLLNAAERCYDMGNFHSARSIIAGLQSPAIYRLKETWTRLKMHHATRYEIMEKLSKIFKSTRTKKYRKAWMKAEKNPPMMPFVGHVLTKVLALDSEVKISDKIDRSSNKTNTKTRVKQGQQKQGLKKSIFPSAIQKIKFLSPRCDELLSQLTQANQQRNQVADWLEQCQSLARGYDFPGHSLAWEFLLKARYREDRDNFFASLELEPTSGS